MLPLLMAGMGVAKGMADKQQEQRDRLLQAQTQMYSPWTKLQAQPLKERAGGLQQGMQGYLGGVDYGSDNAMKQALAGKMSAGEMDTQSKMDQYARLLGNKSGQNLSMMG